MPRRRKVNARPSTSKRAATARSITNGWVAASFHGVPWELTGSVGFENNTWELYNVDEDFSQAVDLAAKNPQKLEELKKVFAAEAEKFGVYPLDDRFVERGINPERPRWSRAERNSATRQAPSAFLKAVLRRSISAHTRSPRTSQFPGMAAKG